MNVPPKPIAISVVVPVLNEAGNIPELGQALVRVLAELCQQRGLPDDGFEIIFVDDGRTDESWSLIEAQHSLDRRVGGLRLSRQFGHHVAVTAGLDRATVDAIVVMDGDLQDPPEENITSREGGAVATNSAAIADRVRLLRQHGMSASASERYTGTGIWTARLEIQHDQPAGRAADWPNRSDGRLVEAS